MYLLDTNVVSELRKEPSGKANQGVVNWAAKVHPDFLFISAITIFELDVGVLQMERRDVVQGKILRFWLENHVLPSFAGRILPVDIVVAQRCASLHVPNPCAERDSFIAATAVAHGLTMVSRNVADFKPMGVRLINPWT